MTFEQIIRAKLEDHVPQKVLENEPGTVDFAVERIMDSMVDRFLVDNPEVMDSFYHTMTKAAARH